MSVSAAKSNPARALGRVGATHNQCRSVIDPVLALRVWLRHVVPHCQTIAMKLSTWEANPVFGSRSEIPSDRYLFHYTSVERCAVIGFTSCIALGPLTPLNDPRESQLRQVMTMTTGSLHSARSVTVEERKEFE